MTTRWTPLALLAVGLILAGCDESAGPAAATTDPLVGPDSLYVRIELSQLPAALTFNQGHVLPSRIEYWWGVLFNTDGNPATGRGGYDIEIALAYAKSGDSPFEASPIDGAWHQLIEWTDEGSGLRGYVRHQDVVVRLDPTNRNALVLAVPLSWEEAGRIKALDSLFARASHASPTPPTSTDQTRAGAGTQTITDPAGDVPHGFIDILSANWGAGAIALVSGAGPPAAVRASADRGRERDIPTPQRWVDGTWR